MPTLIMATALVGLARSPRRCAHRQGVIYAIGQTYGTLCLWRAYRATWPTSTDP